VTGASIATVVPVFPELHWQDGFTQLWGWLLSLGKPLLIGLPILAIGLAVLGYVFVRVGWRLFVLWKWHTRHG
jgi:uncharacterized protein (DUF2062 family)